MRKETIVIECDVCKEKVCTTVDSIKMQIVFTTEQTEGRSTKPYFSSHNLDLCEKCLNKALTGNYIFGHGAQGHNTYYFLKGDK